jgi:hypothetical protein
MICEIFGFGVETGFLACNNGKCLCWFDGIATIGLIMVLIGLLSTIYLNKKYNKQSILEKKQEVGKK